MSDDYRKELMAAYKIMDRLKSDRETALKSGLKDEKIREDLQSFADRARVEVMLVQKNLAAIAQESVHQAGMIADKIRRKGKDPALMQYHQQRARDALSGLSADQMLEKYKELASNLKEDELDYLYVLEDAAKGLMKDAAYNGALEEVIKQNKGPLEEAALREVDRRLNFLNNDATLRGLIEMEVESVAKGEAPAGHDFAALYDEMIDN